MRKIMFFYTEQQLTAAQRILDECFTDYMAYVDSIGTMLEANAEEHDLPNHLQSKLDIIKHGMMEYEYFVVILGENFKGYSELFKAVFSHWLDNKYLHHLGLLGYQTNAEIDEDEKKEMNRKGQLLIEVTNAIAGSLNKDGSIPMASK
ncbi:hypothetical protein ACYSNO_10870 [Enterococcus sp. LJL98]